ncbi:MAG: hypothetical protein JXB05_13775, partial [Myxococcaceae bacterium]|nr:hypothetical protein [Myxococcaceae bacterium]
GTGEPVVLRGHEAGVLPASFSPDGQRIVTASADKTARMWNAEGAGEPVVLRGHEAVVLSASFSPDGQRIVTASWDRTARVWKAEEPVVLTEPELQRLLRMANNDCLSPELRRTYLDDDETQAQQRYEECERSYGRPPFFTSIRPPQATAPATP